MPNVPHVSYEVNRSLNLTAPKDEPIWKVLAFTNENKSKYRQHLYVKIHSPYSRDPGVDTHTNIPLKYCWRYQMSQKKLQLTTIWFALILWAVKYPRTYATVHRFYSSWNHGKTYCCYLQREQLVLKSLAIFQWTGCVHIMHVLIACTVHSDL